MLNVLLESKGGWTVHGCKCGSYIDKRLPRLSVLRQGLCVGTQRCRDKLYQRVARNRASSAKCAQPDAGAEHHLVAGYVCRHDRCTLSTSGTLTPNQALFDIFDNSG